MKAIPLSQGKFALVDDSDFEHLSQFQWSARQDRNTWYAFRSQKKAGKRGSVDMHRFIMGLQKGDPRRVDHIDGNGLNNQRSNLQICTHKENSYKFFRKLPRSGFRGVCWNRVSKKWQASLRHDGKKRCIGYFDDPAEAAKAYDAEVIRLRGPFAVTNTMLKTA
jgi:hypothetical protein